MLPKIGQGMGLHSWGHHHIPILLKGVELGMNYLDSAEDYGISEKILGEVISEHGIREEIIIGTKFGPQNNSYDNVIKSAHRSLSCLKVDFIDLYQLHWPNPDVPLEESLEAMMLLKDQGKIKEIGVGNLTIGELKKACEIVPIYSFQIEYNLFDRSPEKNILPFCKSHNIKVIAYSPLDRGRLCPNKQKDTLDLLSCKYNKQPSQVALNWITSQGCTAIPTARKLSHLLLNANAVFDLDDEDKLLLSQADKELVRFVSPSDIKVSEQGEDNRKTYYTLEEAKSNYLNFVPSPSQLAISILESHDMKPVRIIPSEKNSFYLVEGRMRYWGWVIAFGNKPIPALVRDNF